MNKTDFISANLITEIQCGTSVNLAISEQRRADFALLLAMLSNDACETTPIDTISPDNSDSERIRKQLSVPQEQPLISTPDSYKTSAHIADLFHSAGLYSAKFNHYLTPEALCYRPEKTQGLEEDVYHNLSGHTIRRMNKQAEAEVLSQELYHQLIDAQRRDQLMSHS
ncbi:VC2046/SO_2500 family protein [Vibrio salinus]|uniref:VC2046/SO_2500 family protein n=1 Tax=Vibrio salinus TaxID=2899784 RepID=UPI001E431EB5|nr:VC2046/SO_2500 family protein [Vibrio salinus]MCE0494584.1 hypothetical protein [Vibrio salinus]